MIQASRKRPLMYGLSTCGWCAKARQWLDQNAQSYDLVYVDLLEATEKDRVVEELRQCTGHVAFPIVFFGKDCVVGYRPDDYNLLLER